MALVDKPGEASTSIPLYVINGVATVWDAQAAATLHCQHDISGLRAGTLPGVVQQNAFLGLPLTLMMEEATHLVRKGIAHLVPVPVSGPPPPELVAARTAARVARTRALAERMRQEEEKKVAALRAQFGDAGDAARAKREARARKRAGAQKAAALAAGEEESAVNAAYEVAIAAIGAETEGKGKEKEKANANAKDKAKDEPMASADNTSVFTIVPALPIVPDLLPNTSTTLSSTAFPFPRTVRDSALADSFDALHARGLRMGLGPRFGGEYLIYPGDYLRYHAHFTSQIIVRDEPIRPAELVAWGRLGTGTKKAGLLCCWDDGGRGDEPVKGTGEVEFFSLEWANFG